MNDTFIDQVEYLGSAMETGQIAESGDAVLALIEYAETCGFVLTVRQAFTLLRTWHVARAGFACAEAVYLASQAPRRPSPVPRKKLIISEKGEL